MLKMKSKPETLSFQLKRALPGETSEFILHSQNFVFSVEENISIFVYARIEDFPGKTG